MYCAVVCCLVTAETTVPPAESGSITGEASHADNTGQKPNQLSHFHVQRRSLTVKCSGFH